MSIYKSAVKKPITTMMVFVAIIVFGIYSLTRLPVDLYPEVELPGISVLTLYLFSFFGWLDTSAKHSIRTGKLKAPGTSS